jgi:hypothetical protein
MPLNDKKARAVFVDMDNLSVMGLDTVLSRWRYRQTPVTLRRAYGGLEKLKGASAVLQRHGFHVRANHGKGTTDVLLTVDVMDALHAGLLPPVVAIASSDADFVPLVWRLRDAGIRVVGVAERGKANDDALIAAYHDMEWCDELVSPPSVLVSTPVPMPAPVPVPLPTSVPVPAHAPKPASAHAPEMPPALLKSQVPAKSPAPVKPSEPDLAKARAMVEALQPWQPNTLKPLQQAGSALRALNMVSGSKPLHTHFRQFPGVFQVMPSSGPARAVKLLKRP